MKRLLSLLLVLVTILCFVSCGEQRQPADPTEATGQTEATEGLDETKPTKTTEPTEHTLPAADNSLEITFCVPVATGVCVVGGLCSAECVGVQVTDEAGTVTEITPAVNDGYFFGQVKIAADTTLTVTEQYADGTGSEGVQIAAEYHEMDNIMLGDEYMPVFGNDSRMHFYSALLTYSLSDVIPDGIKTRTERIITDNVNSLKSVNPDAELIYFVVPSSASVYPEGVGADFPAAQGESLYEAFETIATGCGATVIYPLDTFLSHRDDGAGYKIYHNTDSHWTAYGAYWGVHDLMEHIAQKFPAAAPRSVAEMEFYTKTMWGGDALFSFGDGIGFEDFSYTGRSGETEITKITELTTMFSRKMPTDTLESVYRGGISTYVSGDDNSHKATVKNKEGEGLPTALILRDSFSCPAYDIVNDRFSTVWWQASHNYGYPEGEVKQYEPDYVIYLISERNLLKVMLENANASLLGYVK